MRARLLVPLLAALLLAAAVATAQEWEKYQFRATPLAENLTALRGAGGNLVACHGPDGLLVVDTDYEPMAAKLLAALDSLHAGSARAAVLTHWHFDHVGGNAALAAAGFALVGHENVRARMEKGQTIAIIDETIAPAPPAALPGVTFSDRLTLRLNGETIEVLHYPHAHTDGDAVVRFVVANVVHTGDLWFHGGYPFIDVSSDGGIDGLIAALEQVLALCDDATRIVPGHGPPGVRSDLAAHLAMLKEARALVAKEKEAGKDLAATIAAKPTATLDETWGKRIFPPDQFVEMVYRTLGR